MEWNGLALVNEFCEDLAGLVLHKAVTMKAGIAM